MKGNRQIKNLLICVVEGSVFICGMFAFRIVIDGGSILISYEEQMESGVALTTENLGNSVTAVEAETIEYVKTPYWFEDDYYVDSENIDAYRGMKKGTTKQEGKEIEAAALIVYEDMMAEAELRNGVNSINEDYEEAVNQADAIYVEYYKWCQNPPDGSILVVDQLLRQMRIELLDTAIKYRIKADDSYECAENRRLIAGYYTEMGDEYRMAGDKENAEYCYEQSAIWGMKALYLAVPGNDIEQMENCLNKVKIAANRMMEMEGEKCEELNRIVSIYTKVVAIRNS